MTLGSDQPRRRRDVENRPVRFIMKRAGEEGWKVVGVKDDVTGVTGVTGVTAARLLKRIL